MAKPMNTGDTNIKKIRIAVHVHIFYEAQWDNIKICLKNIEDYDLFITLIKKNDELIRNILDFRINTCIMIVDNTGYDIWPFMHTINTIDLDKYDYIIKLHTKRDMPHGTKLNCFSMSGSKWRNYLLSFCSTKKNFDKCLHILEKYPQIGMLANGRLIVTYDLDKKELSTTKQMACEIIENLGLKIREKTFVGGTMFIVRANLLKLLQHKTSANDFEPSTQKHNSTMAHVYERVFGYLISAQGYIIEDYNLKLKQIQALYQLRYVCSKIFGFIFKRTITNKKYVIKIFRIPIYYKIKDKKNI